MFFFFYSWRSGFLQELTQQLMMAVPVEEAIAALSTFSLEVLSSPITLSPRFLSLFQSNFRHIFLTSFVTNIEMRLAIFFPPFVILLLFV